MSKQIVWKGLTPTESRTLEEHERAGVEIFEAPIEIESADQIHAMGLTWEQCRTWYFGTKRVVVHLTPSDEQTYRFLRDELRAKHRNEYRERRCMIPGKLKPLIPCPEKNSCKNCPYPQHRDNQLPDLCWDDYATTFSEVAQPDPEFQRMADRATIADVIKAISAQNPKFAQAIVLKEYYGLSVAEIAEKLDDTPRNIYFYLEQAKKIGRQYKRDNESPSTLRGAAGRS